MRTAQSLRDAIAESRLEIQAAVDIATQEERELTEDEQTLVDSNLEAIKGLEKSLESRTKIDEQTKILAAARLTPEIDDKIERKKDPDNPRAHITVPAKAKLHRQLKAFVGSDGERDAYISGHVILAGMFGREASVKWCADHGLIQGVMKTTTNSGGGFLVPDEMQAALIRLREATGVFPQFCRNVPMGSEIVKAPSLLSDVTAYWPGESGEITASDATLGERELMARKLACLTKISSELDEDAVIDVGEMITASMAYAMALKLDDAGFNGDGTSTYGGIVGLKSAIHANAIPTTTAGNDAADNLDLLDFEQVVGAYPEYPNANPRWFMSKPVFMASYGRLQNAAGGNTTENLGDGPVPMILGYPVTFAQAMTKTTGTQASTIIAYFGDLSLGVAYGTRRSSRVEVSTDRYFETDEIAIKTTERVAITVTERGDTIRNRPILALKTAA